MQRNGIKLTKKQQRILLFLLLLPIIMFVPHAAEAAGFLPEEVTEGYLYNRYPITHYSLDSYVDTSGNWLPWNWGKGMSDGVFSFLSFLFSGIFTLICVVFHLIGIMLQELFTLDIISGLADKIGNVVQGLAGFGSAAGANGMFSSALVLVVTIMGGWLIYTAFVKRDSSTALSGLGGWILIMAVSIGFFLNAGTVIKGANALSSEAQQIVSVPITAIAGMNSDPSVGIREQYFNSVVYEPYLLFQYGTTDVPAEEADILLSQVPGSEGREEHVQELAKAGNTMMSGWVGLAERFNFLPTIVAVNCICSFVVLFFAAICLYHQVSFLLYVALSPIVLTASLLPGSTIIARRWMKKTVYELIMKVLITALLTIMFALSSMVMDAMGTGGYLFGAIVRAIIYITVFLKRKKILGLITLPDMQPDRGGGLMHMAFGALGMMRMSDYIGKKFGGDKKPLEGKEEKTGASATEGKEEKTSQAENVYGNGQTVKKSKPYVKRSEKPKGDHNAGQPEESTNPENHSSVTPLPEHPSDMVNREENPDFERFWEAYPARTGKTAAKRSWDSQIEKGADPEDLIKAAENYAADCNTKKTPEQYVKRGSNFLGEDQVFEDYTPENYQPAKPIKREKPANEFHNFDQRDTDYETMLREERITRNSTGESRPVDQRDTDYEATLREERITRNSMGESRPVNQRDTNYEQTDYEQVMKEQAAKEAAAWKNVNRSREE